MSLDSFFNHEDFSISRIVGGFDALKILVCIHQSISPSVSPKIIHSKTSKYIQAFLHPAKLLLVPNTAFSLKKYNTTMESYRYVSSDPTLSYELHKLGNLGAAGAEFPFTGVSPRSSGVKFVVGG